MLPEPIFLSLARFTGFLPRLAMQIGASALLTTFYTPGGAAGWILDLILRGYFAISRGRDLGRPSPIRSLAAVSSYLPRSLGASRIRQVSSKSEQLAG
jgi:hypothetical protein